MQCFSKRALWG